ELSRRTQRANLRFLARRILPVHLPAPAGPPRARAKAAYSAAEVAGFLVLAAAAVFAGARPLCGGSSPTRKNLTADLVGRLAGGGGLPRLEGGRLRSTWLAEHLDRLGLSVLMAAAGLSCSQRLGDLAAAITPVDQDQAMVILGAR